MKILVVGGFDGSDAEQNERLGAFSRALGSAIADHGHVLLNGCRTAFDALVVEAARKKLRELGEAEPDRRIISYVLAGDTPAHDCGTILKSRLADWEIDKEAFYIPEQVQQADVVILIGGFEGTFRAANWARIAGKPLLPFTAFGGAAEKIYAQELNDFEQKYAGLSSRLSTSNSTIISRTGPSMRRICWRWPRKSLNPAASSWSCRMRTAPSW